LIFHFRRNHHHVQSLVAVAVHLDRQRIHQLDFFNRLRSTGLILDRRTPQYRISKSPPLIHSARVNRHGAT
jgi:hypothetical protein